MAPIRTTLALGLMIGVASAGSALSQEAAAVAVAPLAEPDAVSGGFLPAFDQTETPAQTAGISDADLPLPGLHNRGNLCAVLATLEVLGLDAEGLAE